MDLKALGEYLRRLRQAQGMSAREVSRRTGISNPYLIQIEKGQRRPSPDILKRLAPVYRVSLRQLLEMAGHLGEPEAVSEEAKVKRAFQYVMADPRFQFGTRLEGKGLTVEAKRFIVQMYERLTGKRLLD